MDNGTMKTKMSRVDATKQFLINISGSYFLMKKDCVSFCYYSYGLEEYLNNM